MGAWFDELREGVRRFADLMWVPMQGGYASVPGGRATGYGTAYLLLTQHYVGLEPMHLREGLAFLAGLQDDEGYVYGPELAEYEPKAGARHDKLHLKLHSTCSLVPAMLQWGQTPGPLTFARAFLDEGHLREWMGARNWGDAWLEGNNILFVGQLLMHLRDVEGEPRAAAALERWFEWLDANVDPRTGLWGSDRGTDVFGAMCGGYHQLLAYYHEGREVKHPRELLHATLSLQHQDGGFNPHGGGGACEETDAVDILVNVYKLPPHHHRHQIGLTSGDRARVRRALRRCLDLIDTLRNPDGGFPYRRGSSYNHMGMPDTYTKEGESSAFSTWFRVHTLGLMAEVISDDARLEGAGFRFSDMFSMGWHRPWGRAAHRPTLADRVAEVWVGAEHLGRRALRRALRRARGEAGRAARKAGML